MKSITEKTKQKYASRLALVKMGTDVRTEMGYEIVKETDNPTFYKCLMVKKIYGERLGLVYCSIIDMSIEITTSNEVHEQNNHLFLDKDKFDMLVKMFNLQGVKA